MNFESLKCNGNRKNRFIDFVGLEITDIREGYAKGELELKPMHANPIGSVHGGVIFTLTDNIGGIAATTRGKLVTTLDANINYLSPAMKSTKLFVEAHEVKNGKKILVYDVDVTDDLGSHIASARFTYYAMKDLPEGYFD